MNKYLFPLHSSEFSLTEPVKNFHCYRRALKKVPFSMTFENIELMHYSVVPNNTVRATLLSASVYLQLLENK